MQISGFDSHLTKIEKYQENLYFYLVEVIQNWRKLMKRLQFLIS